MKTRTEYKRLIKLIFSIGILTFLILVYGMVWVGYYNKIIMFPFFRKGNWMMMFLYGILLLFFMNAYGGFKVGYLKRGNLIYSQVLAVIFTNVFTYFQIAVLDKRFFNPVHLLVLTFLDFWIIVIWTMVYQWMYNQVFPPRKMLLIMGEKSDYHLMEKINSREDKYEICKVMKLQEGIDKLIAEMQNYDGVIIGDIPSHERNLLLKYGFENAIRTYSVPKISDILLRSTEELNLFDSPLLLSRNEGLGIEQQISKRAVDVIGASIIGIVTLPLFLIFSIAIKLTDGGPVFYKQVRLTKDGQPFEIYKFRTMIVNAEQNGVPRLAAEGDKRILPVGRILRRSRLDELPQVINILKGEMSLVGPRPERPELVAEFTQKIPEFPCRMKVKAGLTGYAQVFGKYNTTAYDKLKLDLTYIRNYSFFLDLKLIVMTPKILFLKESTEGVNEKQT